MSRNKNSLAVCLLAAAITSAGVGAAYAATATTAKATKVKLTCPGKVNSKTYQVEGKCTGSPGKATWTGQIHLALGTTDYTMKFKQGTLKLKAKTRLVGTTLTGTWKVVGGTKGYKGAKGSGKVSAGSLTAPLLFTGKLK